MLMAMNLKNIVFYSSGAKIHSIGKGWIEQELKSDNGNTYTKDVEEFMSMAL